MEPSPAAARRATANPFVQFLVQSVVLAAAWLVPGLGHLLLRRWQRALVFFFAVGALGMIGLRLGGYVFSSNAGDFFEWLGYFADVGAGGFYLYAQHWWRGAPDISRAAGDVGTRFLATAGVLNFLCMLDVVDIFRGRKK